MARSAYKLQVRLAPSRPRHHLKFYVYEHWRPDLDLPFYVGKGQRNRAYRFGRNAHYNAVMTALASAGMCIEVRMVASGLTEVEAFRIECQRITFWRQSGVELTNRTAGWDGRSGFIRPFGIRQTEAAKRKISDARKGIKFTAEHRAKLAQRKKGVKRKPFKLSTIQMMRAAAAKREARKREIYGENVTRWSLVRIPS